MILKVFPFESEVGQECYYYHLYHYCTADPSQTTNRNEWLAECYKMLLLYDHWKPLILDIKMSLNEEHCKQ